jgi:hypothetical protein
MRRVTRPGGRILTIDFGSVDSTRKGVLAHFHRHGHTKPAEIMATFGDAGLTNIETGDVGAYGLQFVAAVAPGRR